jgi:hypothetical protein
MSERLRCIVVALLGPLAASGGESAAIRSDELAIDSARKSLSGRTDYPWYDPQSDQLRRIEPPPPPETRDNRESNWEATSKRRASSPAAPGGGPFWRVFKVAFWVLLAALLLAILTLMIRAFRRRKAQRTDPGETAPPAESSGDADRVESLPFRLRGPRSDLLAEAARNYEQGEYSEAIVYLFSYQLVQLDKRQLVRLARGKTNRQYLRELGSWPQLYQILEKTMIAFEDVFFGGRRLERERFESCWRALDDFHRLASFDA